MSKNCSAYYHSPRKTAKLDLMLGAQGDGRLQKITPVKDNRDDTLPKANDR